MSICDVYVGDLGKDGKLDWGGDYQRSNVPPRIGPVLTHFPSRRNPFFELLGWVRNGRLVGEQVDWGATAAMATPAQIRAFADTCFEPVPEAITALIDSLMPDKVYALVAVEL